MRYNEFGSNYNQMTTAGSPTFTGLTVSGNSSFGTTAGNTVTLNSMTWSLPLSSAWTLTKTAAASTAETLMKMMVSDDSSYFQIINGTTTNGSFTPSFEGVQSSNNTALTFFGTGTTDTGTGNPLLLFLARLTGGGTVANRNLLEVWNNTTAALRITAGYNTQLTGPATSPSLNAAVTDLVSLGAIDTAAADRNLYARNENGNNNRLTGLACRVSTDFSKTSDSTLANVTGLSLNVAANEIYGFRAVLFTTSSTSGGIKFAIGGTATATTLIADAEVVDASTLKTVGTQRVTALATTIGDVTSVGNARVVIEGFIKVNAAGTLTIQFAQNASNAIPSNVKAGSYFELISIGL